MKIRSFKGLTPAKGKAKAIASLPYDVVNYQQACEQAEGRPLSFMRVVRSEIELPEGTDPYSDAVYAHAKENFERLIANGDLVREPENCMYLYRQEMGGHSQTGLVATFSAEDYDSDVIKKHEKTRAAKENDRYRLTKTLRANTGPVFLTVKDGTALDKIIAEKDDADAIFDFVASDGIRHTGWKISDPEKLAKIKEIFDKIPCAYVADGHHRSASNARCARDLKAENPNHTGDEDYNWFLSVVFPAGQLKILPYNRVVRDLNGMTTEQFLKALDEHFIVERKDGQYRPQRLHNFALYIDKTWYSLTARPGTYDDSDPIGVLDVTISSHYILDELLGIKDLRSDKRIDFVGGIRGLGELERRVDSGEMRLALALYPVTMKQIMDIADTGNIMPPKTTWFEPKLRSGLIIHKLD